MKIAVIGPAAAVPRPARGLVRAGGTPIGRRGRGEHDVVVQAEAAGVLVISAQRNPASSRAMAVTTTPLTFLRAARARKRRQRRSWAVQDRARVSAVRPDWRARRAVPMIGRCW